MCRGIYKGKEDLIIAYGDIVYQKENLVALLESDEDISLMIDRNWRKLWELRLENPLEDAETFQSDSEGFVRELGKSLILMRILRDNILD